MDPAVRVEHILRYVFGVNAVYGIANVLSGGDDQTEGGQHKHCDTVMESKNRRIYVQMADFDQIL